MKKPTKKLTIQSETIRTLENEHLAHAQGGSIVSSGTSVISISSGTSVISPGTSVITPSTSIGNPSGGSRH